MNKKIRVFDMKNKLSTLLLLVSSMFLLAGCIESTEQADIQEQASPIDLAATAPIVTDDLAGDWELTFDSYVLPFRVLSGTDRVLADKTLSSSSNRVEVNDNRMTLTFGYSTATVLVTADLTRVDGAVVISNIEAMTSSFDTGNQYTYAGSIVSTTIDSIDFGLGSFVNTFAVTFIPSTGTVAQVSDFTATINADGTVSVDGSVVPGATAVSAGNLDWLVNMEVVSNQPPLSVGVSGSPTYAVYYSYNNLDLHCYESSWYVSLNCDYVLTDTSGLELETGSAQFTPTGYTAISLAGTFVVHIPGQATDAQVTVDANGSAWIQGYGAYSLGEVLAATDTGFIYMNFTNGDDILTLKWYARPGIAPFQGSARIIEGIGGQYDPLMAIVVERI